jgi:hypothetical protein
MKAEIAATNAALKRREDDFARSPDLCVMSKSCAFKLRDNLQFVGVTVLRYVSRREFHGKLDVQWRAWIFAM